MTFIYKPPVFTILNDREFELVEPFVFEWQEDGACYQLTIPAGYPFDGASVPRLCWSLTGLLPTGVHMGAAAAHDYAYQRRGRLIRGELKKLIEGQWLPIAAVWTRKQCDEMFRRIMEDAGETHWKIKAMFWAVRLFGGKAWNN
jgi:hypothetical protein